MRLAVAAVVAVSRLAFADNSEIEGNIGVGVGRPERSGVVAKLEPGPTFSIGAGVWQGPVAFGLRIVSFTGIQTGAPPANDASANALVVAASVQYAPIRRLWVAAGPGVDIAGGGAFAEDARLGLVVYEHDRHQLNVSFELLHDSRGYTEAQDGHSIWAFSLLVGYQDRPPR